MASPPEIAQHFRMGWAGATEESDWTILAVLSAGQLGLRRKGDKITSCSVDWVGLCAHGRHSTYGWISSGQRRGWSEQDSSCKDSAASSGGQAWATMDRMNSPDYANERSWRRAAGGRRVSTDLVAPRFPRGDLKLGGCCGSGPLELRRACRFRIGHTLRVAVRSKI